MVGRDVAGERLVGEHQAVAQDLGGDVEDVLRQRVGATAQQRQRAPGADEAEARPGAGAVADQFRELAHGERRRIAGGEHQVDRVVDDAAVDVDLVGRGLEPLQLLGTEDLRRVPECARPPG